jgi:hypothetical protein
MQRSAATATATAVNYTTRRAGSRTRFPSKLLALVATSLVATACDSQGNWTGVLPDAAPDSLGVVECDDYVTAFKGCLARVPAEGRTAFENAGRAQIGGFRKMAQDPATKDAAKTACSRALGALKQNPSCK